MYTPIEKLLETLKNSGKKYDFEKIKKAFRYADELHRGQFRKSGDPYISHPIAVASIVADLGLDTDSICSALLHDTVEDCPEKISLEGIQDAFGETVACIVDGLTKIKVMQIEDKEEAHMENIRKMLLAMSKDYRVIFIKLCDRLHNMRTLSAKSPESQRSISLETMYIYAPLAHRLGMQVIKQELENLSLYYLDRIGYDEITEQIADKYGKSSNVIENAKELIAERLKETDIPFEIQARTKSVYSLYRKMYGQNKSFDEIYDFYALRVIVDTELQCYTVLGQIHEMFVSVPGRFKDYIFTPKPNMYRSLHTTVMGKSGVVFEVQIRTHEMHQIAEFGLAAHWKYKSGEKSKEEIDEKLRWIGQLLEADDTQDPDEFMRAFKTDIFNDETFVFTPKGDVFSLPFGSTVIDFAYAIHSAVGNKMIGAKVNGRIVPIDRVLRNGEIVEIITSNSSKGPSRDWLKIVRTGGARNKIRQWYKKEKRDENILVGQREVEKELKLYGRQFSDAQRNAVVEAIAKKMGYQGADDLYNTIGFGGIAMSRISKKLKTEFDKLVPQPEEVTPPVTEIEQHFKVVDKPKNVKHGSGVVVDGEYGFQVKYSKCCNPLPGDEIIGFVTKGFGISVHKTDCPNMLRARKDPENADRWVTVRWESELSGATDKSLYEAVVQIYIRDEIGALAEISMALAEMKVSIMSISSRTMAEDGLAMITLSIGCKNVTHFHSIVSKLKSIKAVQSVSRGYSAL